MTSEEYFERAERLRWRPGIEIGPLMAGDRFMQ